VGVKNLLIYLRIHIFFTTFAASFENKYDYVCQILQIGEPSAIGDA